MFPELRMRRLHSVLFAILLLGGGREGAQAEASRDAWLRYAPLAGAQLAKYESLPANLVVLGDSAVLRSAQGEMIRGVKAMTGKTLGAGKFQEKAIILGTLADIHAASPQLVPPHPIEPDGF